MKIYMHNYKTLNAQCEWSNVIVTFIYLMICNIVAISCFNFIRHDGFIDTFKQVANMTKDIYDLHTYMTTAYELHCGYVYALKLYEIRVANGFLLL